jgi:hypothetical protein
LIIVTPLRFQKIILGLYYRAMAVYFQKSHSDFFLKSRTPPFPQIDGLEQVLPPQATTKNPFRGCSQLKFKASLTFHKRSAYAAFENRPPCLCFYSIMGTQTLRRRYRTLLKVASFGAKPLCPLLRPESRSAWRRTNGIYYLPFQQAAVRVACSLGVDADRSRVPCRAFTGIANQYNYSLFLSAVTFPADSRGL